MARGTQTFDFDFMLCDVITVEIKCLVMFGEVKSIEANHCGAVLNISEYCFDDDSDYLTLESYLMMLAQDEYDEANLPFILELDQ
tara:strand:+ start:65 stop:319 length:255 start_codon:yes stop_codon:yes gene_type:complete